MSYNECDDLDCEGIFYTYGTTEILTDYGFVEQFPQRWIWDDMAGLGEEEDPLMYEIDQVEKPDPYDPSVTTKQYKVSWHTDVRPNLDTLNFMTSQVNRLDKLADKIFEATEALDSRHERYTIRDYYRSLKLALKLAMWSFYEGAVDELAGRDEDYSVANGRRYDTLVERAAVGELDDGLFPRTCDLSHEGAAHDYKTVFQVNSFYQHIEYRYGEKENDSCLWLSDWLQTCSSFRQYHEALVHYPASFLPEVKRVAYLGGGDNMILHEILKYPSIELVLGMELDQQVVRYAYLNLGTLPYFDDPRVQWWFGDATKSLLMLPEEYFGSFDLVLVDLQNFVADAFFVTDTLSIMDTAKLLVKESGGIISKNEDFPNRQLTDFARYTVAMEYCDIPQLCRQSISIGSNSINFLEAPQMPHDIPRIYMNETLQISGKFNHWYDFRDNIDWSTDASQKQEKEEDPNLSGSSAESHGLLVVIEAEELNGSVKDADGFIIALKEVLAAEGIEVLSVDKQDISGSSFHFALVFREGYVVARRLPSVDSYLALDLVLWDFIEKIHLIKSSILSAVGGSANTSSSFRVVMSGIEGGNQASYLRSYSPSDESCTNPAIGGESNSTATDAEVWTQLAKWIPPSSDSSFAVLCGSETEPCASFDLLKVELGDGIVPIYKCNNLDELDETTFFKCEAEMMKSFRYSGVKTLSGIALDSGATQGMARIFLRLITGVSVRANGLQSETNFVVLAETSRDPWRAIFVERFRTELFPFAPAKTASLSFGTTREFSVFESGDPEYYTHLAQFISKANSESNQRISVKNVLSGHAAYVPDFDPPFFTDADFDNTRASKQWTAQRPIGMQALFQMELKAPKKPLEQNEEVLWQRYSDSWLGYWVPATIFGRRRDSTYDISTESRGLKKSIPRDSLRRLDFDASAEPPPRINVGARVLIRDDDGESWQQGFVVSRSDDGKTYRVRLYSGLGEFLQKDITDLIPQMESAMEGELPALSMALLSKAVHESLPSLWGGDRTSGVIQHEHSVRNGGITTAFWNDGNVVLVWNGAKRVDINLFLYKEDAEAVMEFEKSFLEKFSFMEVVGRDLQPRGFGGVVNFAFDKGDKVPIWWPESESRGDGVNE
jgi:spermidine synthase